MARPASSARDPRVVDAAALLRDADARAAAQAVALDGDELLGAALDEGLLPDWVLCAPGHAARAPWRDRLPPGVPVDDAAADALRALAALGQPPRVVARVRLPPPPPLDELPPRALVLAGVRDEGNVGSIVRTGAAFGVPRVLLTGGDPFARRALRASLGAALRPGLVRTGASLADLAALTGRPPLAAAVPRGGVAPGELPEGAVVVLGAERDGLAGDDLARCDLTVSIPAAGFESLNVSAAAAILVAVLARR
ncbi:RNA methyltransferase [Conexibacter sp. SYSU D00693]|uniref:TrmH family RNA methyltransferase n=1 Tax=Conexibacter sp. SYSU D00693 TaxID=2812560 RepID=UPI00196ADCA6|nr:RNA methyltransferase [Conexibacter sp. SYSU D00693]